MPRRWPPFASVLMRVPATRSRPRRTLMAAGKVTVLLFLLASQRPLYARGSQEDSLHVFEFRCEFRMPIAPGAWTG